MLSTGLSKALLEMEFLAREWRAAVTVGKPDPKGFVGFAMRYLMLALPAIFLGHVLDQTVQHVQSQKWLGERPGVYLTVQTIAWLVFFYVVVTYFPHYAWEFQSTYAGLAFGTLFFTVQDNYVTNLQKMLTFTDAIITVDNKKA